MAGSIFEREAPPDERQRVVVASNADHRTAALEYLFDEAFAVHLVNGLATYGGVVKPLLAENGVLMVVFDELEAFLELMRYMSSPDGRMAAQSDVESNLEEDETNSFRRPIGYRLVVVVDSEHLKVDSASSESVMKQQLLRFVALVHDCCVISVSHLSKVLRDMGQLSRLLRQYVLSSVAGDTAEQPVFKYSQSVGSVCLYIPQKWDSWNRIKLVAKAVFYDDNTSDFRLLVDDSDVEQLQKLYQKFLSFESPATEISKFFNRFYKDKTSETTSVSVPSYADIVGAVASSCG